MRSSLGSAALVLSLLAGGCSKREPVEATPSSTPSPTPAPATAKAPEPAPAEPEAAPKAPPAPFDWARATTDGDAFLAVAVAQRAKRFAPTGDSGSATPEVVLQTEPPVKARAVFREDPEGCGEDGDEHTGRWSLEITAAEERWQIVDFASWTTDCAAIDDGFGRDSLRLEARDLVPGGAQELVIVGSESHAAYLDDCDCTTRGGSSEHLWACGLVAAGKASIPVCWAHVERSRILRPTQDPADCACAASVPREEWAVEADFVAPGRLIVTQDGRTDERELTTLPCGLASPPAAFGCTAKPAAAP